MVLVKNDCHKVHRGDDKAFSEAFYRCSYLAKERGKGYGSLGANNYSGSRVRLKTGLVRKWLHLIIGSGVVRTLKFITQPLAHSRIANVCLNGFLTSA